MPDHEHAPTVQLVQERVDARDSLPPRLAAGPRLVDPPDALLVEHCPRHPAQLAVVALAQAPVDAERDRASLERDRRRLDRAVEVRRDNELDAVATPAFAELDRLRAAGARQGAAEPAGGDPGFVVLARRMGL